jgi:hypothetical protein
MFFSSRKWSGPSIFFDKSRYGWCGGGTWLITCVCVWGGGDVAKVFLFRPEGKCVLKKEEIINEMTVPRPVHVNTGN